MVVNILLSDPFSKFSKMAFLLTFGPLQLLFLYKWVNPLFMVEKIYTYFCVQSSPRCCCKDANEVMDHKMINVTNKHSNIRCMFSTVCLFQLQWFLYKMSDAETSTEM